MSYTVLARRYRSQSFDDVVGQEPVARTLRNAIASDRVAHAYLFCGTRGVGKTSMARIFARALNAPDTIPDCPQPAGATFPSAEVQQRMADAIMKGEDLNVIEIDGASNNKVEDARQLISNAGLTPTSNARYKIYIIDEVHMLSNSAFNALLKTMEEPPPHVKFILCTTEAHKVPATIHSRCQRFDFRNIPTRQIAGHLKAVLDKEGIAVDEEVIFQLALLGNGSMRDALSLMDRLIATGESPVTLQTLEDMLGLPAQTLVAGCIDAMAAGDPKATLESVAALLNRGISQDQLVDVLIARLRHLMLLAACGPDSELVDLSDEARSAAAKQAQQFDTAALVHMIALCENLQRHAKSSTNPRALLDATVVRLALSDKMADVTAILSGQARLPAGNAAHDTKKKVADTAFASDRASKPRVVDSAPGDVAPPTRSAAPPLTSPPQTSAEVWSALCDRVGSIPSMAFVDHLRLAELNQHRATIEPLPGQRDMARFAATDQRRKRISDELMTILGRRVEVVVRQPAGATVEDDATDEPTPAAARRGGVSQIDRRAAMELPLVRDAIEMFPDAMPIDFRDEKPQG